MLAQKSHLLLEEAPGLGQQGLAAGGLASDGLESLDVQGLAGLLTSGGPLRDALVVLLSVGAASARHDLSVLVLDQVGFLQATAGLRLGATEHGGFRALALSDLRNLHPIAKAILFLYNDSRRSSFRHETLKQSRTKHLCQDSCVVPQLANIGTN